MAQFLHKVVGHRPGKPRKVGLTFAVDRLDPGPASPSLLAYVDAVKIGWGLPALLETRELEERIRGYHKRDVLVTSGGTLTEYALLRKAAPAYLEALADAGFDAVELSEGRVALTDKERARFATQARRRGLKLAVKVGRKSPNEALPTRELLTRIDEALLLEPWKVIIEAGEGASVALFDGGGHPRWDVIELVRGQVPDGALVIEAPLRLQRSALILRLGADVNIGGVPLPDAPELETQRLGIISGDTFGLERRTARLRGGPSVKFVHHLLRQSAPLGQEALVRMSGLPRRTVQSALDSLRAQGHLHEEADRDDLRRRVYRAAP